jgi:hypothetical protein
MDKIFRDLFFADCQLFAIKKPVQKIRPIKHEKTCLKAHLNEIFRFFGELFKIAEAVLIRQLQLIARFILILKIYLSHLFNDY